jgi:sugar phosphate isomerase/epimerase
MRLGLNWVPVRNQEELTAALPLIDELELGAIAAPTQMAEWSLDECAAYGEMVRSHGLIIGEVGYWENLLIGDEALRAQRIDKVRSLLRKAEAMHVGCVVTLVGSFGDKFVSPHADNWSDRARERAAENCLRILDGLSLTHTTYALEPWCNGFFHEPQAVEEFLSGIDHPRLRLHLDVMNMHSVQTYFQSTQVIGKTFALLADKTVSVHAKDLLWDPTYMFMRLDEVMPGEGVLDYDLFLRSVDRLSPDIPVYTEHWQTGEEYVEAIRRLRSLAGEAGIEPVTR